MKVDAIIMQRQKFLHRNSDVKNNTKNKIKNNIIKQDDNQISFNGFGLLGVIVFNLVAGKILLDIQSKKADKAMFEAYKKQQKLEEEQRLIAANKRNAEIEQIQKKLKISPEEARKYYEDFLSIAKIEETNDGFEKGINAIRGYGIEKYKFAIEFLTPIIKAQNKKDEKSRNRVPDSLLLYGPPGSGKTYSMDNLCDHLKEFGVDVKEIVFDKKNHFENMQILQETFNQAEENFKNTGKYTVIKFPQDIELILTDRYKNSLYPEETELFSRLASNCASRGVVWIGTTNYPKKIDESILKNVDLKIPLGDMKDFNIKDMIRYSILQLKNEEVDDVFLYWGVENYIEKINQDFTPYEYKMLTQNALDSHDPEDFYKIIEIGDMIREINKLIYENGIVTLDEETKSEFQNNQKYLETFNKDNWEKY